MDREYTIKVLIDVVEATDSKRVGYKRIAEEITAWIYEEGLSHAQVGERIGRGRHWVGRILQWDKDGAPDSTPFARKEWHARYEQRQVPTRHEDKVEMATKLLAEPEVVAEVLESRTKAASQVRMQVSRQNAEERQRSISKAEQDRNSAAVPIEGIFATIAEKISSWSDALLQVESDLIEARDKFGASWVVIALRSHGETCHRIADRLDLEADVPIKGRTISR